MKAVVVAMEAEERGQVVKMWSGGPELVRFSGRLGGYLRSKRCQLLRERWRQSSSEGMGGGWLGRQTDQSRL